MLGTGPWARRAHAPALAGHPDVEFTGVWGRRPEAAAALAEEYATTAYRDADALVAASDAVALALPPDVQPDLAVRAARAGRHLLLDKPLALTVEQARRVADAVDDAQVAAVVFFTLRFRPAVQEWLDRQAALGGWFTARADWLAAVFTADTASPYAASPWRREHGALWDVGPHALSVLLPVLGDVVEVTAAHGPGDTTQLFLRHDRGAASSLTLSLTAPPAAAGVTVELRGDHGVATLPADDGEGPVPALRRAVDALAEAARTGRPHPCDPRFALRVTQLLAQAGHLTLRRETP
nr:Gfo/Idh/MocA family oxidoreductase [Streptomyces sp. SID5468]